MQSYTSVTKTQDFDILVQNVCLVTVFSLLASNPLIQTSPIYSYTVSSALHTISWPLSDISATQSTSLCGSYQYTLYDITSGSEDPLSTSGVFTSDLSTDPQTLGIQTNDLAKAATYNLRYQVAW